MQNLAEPFLESASAVTAFGSSEEEIMGLDGDRVAAAFEAIKQHRRTMQAYEVLFAAQLAKLSSHELGYKGLARSSGSATPAHFIQAATGVGIDEATKLARMGSLVADAQRAQAAPQMDGDCDELATVPAPTPLADATVAGDVSLAAADAIRKGLGEADEAVSIEQIRLAEAELLKKAGSVSPEMLLKLARLKRAEMDGDAVARNQKERAQSRYVRKWRRDGMSYGSWAIPDEDGGADLDTALELMLASRKGGPRFPETDANGNPIVKSAADIALEDSRTFEQVLADGFMQIVINGLRVDPTIVPGAWRAPVRVIVTEKSLLERKGSGILEDSLSAVTLAKLDEYLCEGGQIGILFDERGQLLDVGREQRLFTKAQRTGLAVRDGGCRFPGCDKPPSWTEAHHIVEWFRKKGRTDVRDGILLCRYHHSWIHETDSEIIRKGDTYWLKPGPKIDPAQTLIEMPSKNPLVAAMKYLAASSPIN